MLNKGASSTSVLPQCLIHTNVEKIHTGLYAKKVNSSWACKTFMGRSQLKKKYLSFLSTGNDVGSF